MKKGETGYSVDRRVKGKGTARWTKKKRAEATAELGYTSGKEAKGLSRKQGVVSIHGERRIPTGRVPDKYGSIGEGNPPNARLAALRSGDLDVSELSDQELAAGIPLCDDGKFSVRAAAQASALPQYLQKKIQRELIDRCKRKLDGGALSAVNALVGIVEDPDSDVNATIKASTYLIDRLMGKTPEKVVHSQDKPWQVIQASVTVIGGSREESRLRRALPAADVDEVVDAEVIEEDDEDED